MRLFLLQHFWKLKAFYSSYSNNPEISVVKSWKGHILQMKEIYSLIISRDKTKNIFFLKFPSCSCEINCLKLKYKKKTFSIVFCVSVNSILMLSHKGQRE